MCQPNRRNRQRQFGRQPLAPFEPTFSHGLTHGLLNLALSGDAELFEQLTDARIEDVLFHRVLLRSRERLSLARRPIEGTVVGGALQDSGAPESSSLATDRSIA